MAVSDTGMTPLNKIIDRCFKEIGLKQRDYNGRTHFGSLVTLYCSLHICQTYNDLCLFLCISLHRIFVTHLCGNARGVGYNSETLSYILSLTMWLLL